MEVQVVQGEIRSELGKSGARKLRAAQRLPAVVYGPGGGTDAITVCPRELAKALATSYGRNVVIALHVAGHEEKVLLRELHCHPVTAAYIHADFYRVDENRAVEVPVVLRTSGRALGVQRGGKMRVLLRQLPLRCKPSQIPDVIDVDVSALDMGQVFSVQDLQLPAGVQVTLPAKQTLIAIAGEKKKATADAEEAAA